MNTGVIGVESRRLVVVRPAVFSSIILPKLGHPNYEGSALMNNSTRLGLGWIPLIAALSETLHSHVGNPNSA